MDVNPDAMRMIVEVTANVLNQRIEKCWNYNQILLAEQCFGYYLGEVNGWTDLVCEEENEKKKKNRRKSCKSDLQMFART